MSRLTHADQRKVLGVLKELYAETGLERLREQMVRLSARLVACDLGSYNEIVSRDARLNVALRYPDSELIRRHFPAFVAYLNEHPIVPHMRSAGIGAIKFSDFVSERQLHRLNIYHEYFGQIGVRRQIVAVLDPGGHVQRGISLNRGGRDFSERDRAVLNVLAPHLAQAFQNVSALHQLRSATDAMSAAFAAQAQAILLVHRRQRVQWISPQAHGWLREFLAVDLGPDARLPDNLSRWLVQQRRLHADPDRALACPPGALRLSKPRGHLVVRYAAEDADGNASLLLALEQPAEAITLALPALTDRENEVLGWIAHGKGNPEIAGILGLKLRTVYKHVENIFAKLEVESRAAAMLVAFAAAKERPFVNLPGAGSRRR